MGFSRIRGYLAEAQIFSLWLETQAQFIHSPEFAVVNGAVPQGAITTDSSIATRYLDAIRGVYGQGVAFDVKSWLLTFRVGSRDYGVLLSPAASIRWDTKTNTKLQDMQEAFRRI